MSDWRNSADPTGREDEDVFGVVYEAQLRAGAVVRVDAYPLPDDAVYQEESEPKRVDEPEPQRDRDKVHPILREWLGGRSGDEREHIVVVLADPMSIPRFPEPATDKPRDSVRNQPLLEQAQGVVRSIEAERAPGYERLEAELADYEASLVERFWLINGVVADLPLKSVERLAT